MASIGSADDDDGMIVGINVTPLVDISLVLLIIFMVTTTYILPALHVQLPKATTGKDTVSSRLSLELTREGTLSLNGAKTTEDEVRAFIAKTLPEKPDLQAVIAANQAVSHGAVVHLLNMVGQAGVHKFALTVDPSAR